MKQIFKSSLLLFAFAFILATVTMASGIGVIKEKVPKKNNAEIAILTVVSHQDAPAAMLDDIASLPAQKEGNVYGTEKDSQSGFGELMHNAMRSVPPNSYRWDNIATLSYIGYNQYKSQRLQITVSGFRNTMTPLRC